MPPAKDRSPKLRPSRLRSQSSLCGQQNSREPLKKSNTLVSPKPSVDCCALDAAVDPAWAAAEVQPTVCVQGNLDPLLLVAGGGALDEAARACVEAFSGGAHVFNLGHGITPDADPANVNRMLAAIRG